MPQPPNPLTRRLNDALQWLGLPGVVLVAALVCDLVIIGMAATDRIGPPSGDLVLLPGILALSACALYARNQPVFAIFTGSAVLVISTVFIRVGDGAPYSSLLTDISFAETVAGFELVFYCVRAVRGGMAFAGVSTLVVACLLAVAGRATGNSAVGQSDIVQTLVAGLVLLIVSVVAGLHVRKPQQPKELTGPVAVVRNQWPLLGAFSLLLFFEVYSFSSTELRATPVLLCSIVAALLAVLATRYPLQSGLGLAGVLVLSALLTWRVPNSYVPSIGIPMTQVAAGFVMVVLLVRLLSPARAWTVIALLSGAVAVAAVLNSSAGLHLDRLGPMFIAALLVLGIAVATGLYFRSRDSERTQAMQSAVTDAQTSERMALARELHDVVAHHVTGIVVQAQAAKMVAQQNPMVVLEALVRIEDAGTEALTAMRRLVRSMRGDAPAGTSEFSEQATTDLAADLRRLVDAANHGVPTEVDLDLPAGLPQEVARSALRLVQEALTNVGKHATGATSARVSATVSDGELHIKVSDDGVKESRRPPGGSGGYGLVGMRERVELLRGRLSAGPGPDGGWLVEAWLPVEGAE